ncbi:MAG: S53 family peptidase, partial [Candidatus Saccharimonadales bacterium]
NKYSDPGQAVQPDSSGGYGPVEFHTGYQLPCKPGGSVASTCSSPASFGPQTIAIVDAGGYGGSLSSDLQTYDSYYGLPACTIANGCLRVLNQSGNTSPLPSQVSTGWSEEIALDVEMAHMVCQTCKITLVEANDDFISSLSAAENTAAGLSPVAISNSWGSDTDLSSYDNDFKHNGMAVVAATGDNGTLSGGQSWPADIPQVVAATGSTLQLNTDNSWASETVWSGSGGGCSVTYGAPSWQTSRADWASGGCGGSRAFGDVSADADPSTGSAIVFGSSWYLVGGTSLSTPLIASMYALADNVPAGTAAVTLPYQNASASTLRDITSGNDCTGSGQPHCTAKAGFDVPSGLGAPKGLGLFGGSSLPAPSYNTLLSADGALDAGGALGSSASNPAYRLAMQGDGNLVIYKSSSG